MDSDGGVVADSEVTLAADEEILLVAEESVDEVVVREDEAAPPAGGNL